MRSASYKDIPLWNEIPKYIPQSNRLDDSIPLLEQFWEWRGNQIHIDYYQRPDAKVKVFLLHGVGGNGRLLSFIGVPVYRSGFEVIAPDLPGYGLSVINSGVVDYYNWVDMVSDLVEYELSKDERPIVLFGLSAGGMLAYHAACKSRNVSGIIATNLLDQRLQEVRDGSAINKVVSRIGPRMLTILSSINDGIMLPMKAVANMRAIVNDQRLVELLLKDKTSSGTSVSIRFILSLMNASPEIEPEDFAVCPFLLVHPEKDQWTPVNLSRLFFDRLKCKKELVMLDNAGHFPIEQPGLQKLEISAVNFLNSIV